MPANCTGSLLLTTATLATVLFVSPAQAGVASRDYLCGQTAHFLFDDGSGVLEPAEVTSSFVLTVQCTDNGASLSRRGYQYYKAQSDMGSAQTQNNPYFKDNANQGTMPSAHRMLVRPINDPPLASTSEAGLFVPIEPGLPPYDLWEGMDMRVQFFDAQGALALSFVAEGGLTLLGTGPGGAFDVGVTNTYSYAAGTGPLKWMAPESIRGRTPPASGGLYLQDITLTMTLVPTPATGGLAVLGLLVAGRRRR